MKLEVFYFPSFSFKEGRAEGCAKKGVVLFGKHEINKNSGSPA
jgi:hypothetical protein